MHAIVSMHGWSMCLGGVRRCKLFPGCVVIVKEGDLGFPLKTHQAEHLFYNALPTGGEAWVKGGGGRREWGGG